MKNIAYYFIGFMIVFALAFCIINQVFHEEITNSPMLYGVIGCIITVCFSIYLCYFTIFFGFSQTHVVEKTNLKTINLPSERVKIIKKNNEIKKVIVDKHSYIKRHIICKTDNPTELILNKNLIQYTIRNVHQGEEREYEVILQ